MKEEDLEKELDRFMEEAEKKIDEMGLREDFEKFKKEHERKSLEDLLEELKETLIKKHKPDFEIMIKSNEDGKTHQVKILGNRKDVMFGLSELIQDMVKNCGVSTELIKEVVNDAIDKCKEE